MSETFAGRVVSSLMPDRLRQAIIEAFAGVQHPRTHCLGCGRTDLGGGGSIGPFATVAGQFRGRPVFVVLAVIGAEGGTLLPACSDCFIDTARMLGDRRRS